MFIEMSCGKCESTFQVDTEQDDAAWMMAHRFANAHVICGFVAPPLGDMPGAGKTKTKVIKPRLEKAPEGD